MNTESISAESVLETVASIPVLYIDDEIDILQMYQKELSFLGFDLKIAQTADAGLALLEKSPIPVVLLDMKMPGVSGQDVLKIIKKRWPSSEVIVYTGFGDMDMAINALRAGAYHFLTKPIKLAELEIQLKQAYNKFRLQEENQVLQRENQVLKRLVSLEPEIIGESNALQKVFSDIEKVASTHSSVLIEGETGTGKELVARAIHAKSKRASQPFVVVNCGGVTEHALECELFGYRKGAVLGAVSEKVGLFEIAHQGTLFLDEISELPPSIQANLHRVLQNQEIKLVGSTETKSVDVRIIAATNRDLEELVSEGKFRSDLYYRLKIIPIHIPPLRERREDIPLLVDYFMKKIKIGRKVPQSFSSSAMKALMEHHWRGGNIRELENLVQRLMILSDGQDISLEELRGGILPSIKTSEPENTPWMLSLKDVEKQHILRVLEFCEDNKTKAAKILEITPKTLYNKLAEFKQQDQN